MSEEINILTNQYFQQVDLPNLAIPPNNVLIQPAVQEALYEDMFKDSLTPLPPASYRSRVLKLLISRMEEAITDPDQDEIIDTLMETWGALLITPKPNAIQQAQRLSQIKYTAPTPTTTITPPRTIITSESRGVILAGGTTGNRTWEAALHLGTYLSTKSGEALVRDKRVIELGAGTGFLSLFCAKYLGANVVATDREQFLIDNMNTCVALNSENLSPEGKIPMYAGIWDWGTKLQGEGIGEEFDVAIGADLIYDADIIPLLISTVRDLFDNYHVREFILAATLRNEKTFRTFLDACESNHFSVETLPFQSPKSQEQTGFFHSTDIPIHTYQILPS
ncbi:hypothetical protein N7450_010118 [Penicillium hetheringtonii]|uniref:Uncharacterized protein n=1 Tax=Penicillium hetheringtonii TaxID=911720 RepID=A0AAD6DCG2_9EURO|nr:hypothetical protein N7450_010118 [Penicillium hetheringtonii]